MLEKVGEMVRLQKAFYNSPTIAEKSSESSWKARYNAGSCVFFRVEFPFLWGRRILNAHGNLLHIKPGGGEGIEHLDEAGHGGAAGSGELDGGYRYAYAFDRSRMQSA